MVPVTSPGPAVWVPVPAGAYVFAGASCQPTAELPGLSAKSPVTTVLPVLVTVWPATTPKLQAAPRATPPAGPHAAEVVKFQTREAASEFPKVSFAPVVM